MTTRSHKTQFHQSLSAALRRAGLLIAAIIATRLALTANAGSQALPEAPPRPNQPQVTSVSEPGSNPENLSIPTPTGKLSLARAVALAVEQNPALTASAWNAQEAIARIRQARLWPNPVLEAERENFEGTGQFEGSRNAETTLSLAQALPLGGDRRQRRRIAERQADLADWDYHVSRLNILLLVTRRYVDALVSDRRLELAKQELERAQATERIAQARVEAGDASPVQLSRVVVPVVSAELALAKAKRQRDSARRRLALAWGARHATFDELSGKLTDLTPPPSAESLASLINNSPSVARWATEISLRAAQRRLARAEAIPDLTARLGQKHDGASGDDALVVGISLPLPVFDRNQGDLQATRMAERAAFSRKRDAELRLEAQLSSAYATLASAYDETTALSERALPAAEHAFQATRDAFEEGELPFLDVLDAQRTYFQLQEQRLAALAAYHTATAEIEALLGHRLSELAPSPSNGLAMDHHR